MILAIILLYISSLTGLDPNQIISLRYIPIIEVLYYDYLKLGISISYNIYEIKADISLTPTSNRV